MLSLVVKKVLKERLINVKHMGEERGASNLIVRRAL